LAFKVVVSEKEKSVQVEVDADPNQPVMVKGEEKPFEETLYPMISFR